ncbi:MAG: hypothetical protein IJR98_01955 [Synergistaceae bacterium]|nr:hypothetical protein [Synergistaceae bacterium]
MEHQQEFDVLKTEMESLKRTHKDEVDALKKSHEKAIKAVEDKNRKSAIRRNVALILLSLAIILLGFMYYSLSQDNKDLQRKNFDLRNELLSRNEIREREGQAREILSALRSDSIAGKFYDSLVYVDCVERFRDADYFSNVASGVIIGGSFIGALPSNFCREYRSSVSEYGFVNSDGIKSAMQSLYAKDFSVRSDMRFTFELAFSSDSLGSWNDNWDSKKKILEDAAFFSTKNLRPGTGILISELLAKIADHVNEDPVFRFFFKTEHEGVYVAAAVRGNKVTGCYIASNNNAVRRTTFFRDIWEKVRQSDFDGEENVIQVSLWEPDSRLDSDIDFDTCVDIFLNQLLERSRKIETGKY